MRISDWSSDVCSSDLTLITLVAGLAGTLSFPLAHTMAEAFGWRASCFAFALLICPVGLPLMWRGARSLEAVARAAALPAEVTGEGRAVSFLRRPAFWLLAIAFALLGLDRKSTRLNSSH